MRPILFVLLLTTLILLPGKSLAQTPVTTPKTRAPVDEVTKTACVSTFAYANLETLKTDVLAQAKRLAVNDLYGEFITAVTQVENFAVTSDQIRTLSSGFVRMRQDTYRNGTNLAEVCVTISVYTTAEDRAKFQPEAVNKRLCITDPNLTVSQIRSRAQEEALVQALIEYDPRLADLQQETLLRLLRRISYPEAGLAPGTDSYCVQAQAYILPIEVMALLAIPAASSTTIPTPAPTSRFTNTPTPTPTPLAGWGGAEITDILVDGATYVFVPAGEFVRGSDTGDKDERPVKTLFISDFWMKQTEVTNAEFGRCVAAGICTAPNNSRWQVSEYADHPVTNVDWNQANVYAAQWVEGRLPTEAEWEKACIGSDGRIYPWGDIAPDASRANFGNSAGGIKAVGSYPTGASPYGLLDMAGNVWEWTADWYADSYYASAPDSDPTGPGSGTYHVLRGGAYWSNAFGVRCSFRDWNSPGPRGENGGFRVIIIPSG